MARVVLAMSGGVDSSVAAALLREQGHEVIGLFMRHGQPADETYERPSAESAPLAKRGCCSAADAADARRVADALGMAFYALNFQVEFDQVIEYFVDEYLTGRTPNPCVVCNTWLKFGRLFEYADSVQAQYVATGHYARIVQRDGQYALCQAVDPGKDQSYSLFGIRRDRLARLLFPVGEHHKERIRATAAELGLRVAQKPDSQEICFVPDQDHARFIRQRRGDLNTAGDVVTTDGTVVGHHDGFERFTVGQRKGLGIALGEPYYVVRIEPDTRRVVLGTHDALARRELTADRANWLVDLPEDGFRAQVKIRYRSRPVDATVTRLSDSRFHVAFDEPRHGVAPGQAAVCYQGDRVLGGGWIE